MPSPMFEPLCTISSSAPEGGENADVKPGLLVDRQRARHQHRRRADLLHRRRRQRRAARVVRDTRKAPTCVVRLGAPQPKPGTYWSAPELIPAERGRRLVGRRSDPPSNGLTRRMRLPHSPHTRRHRPTPAPEPPSTADQRTRKHADSDIRCWRQRRQTKRQSTRADERRTLLTEAAHALSPENSCCSPARALPQKGCQNVPTQRMPWRRRFPYGDARDATS